MVSPLYKELSGLDKEYGYGRYASLLQSEDFTLIERGAGKGLDLYREILKDAHAYAVLAKRKLSVVGREYEIVSASTKSQDKKIADFVTEQLDAIRFDKVCANILDSLLYGFSVNEIIWQKQGSSIGIEDIRLRRSERFRFKIPEGAKGNCIVDGFELRLLNRQGMLMDGEPLPDRKFIVHSYGDDTSPYGLGLGSILFWPTFFKREDIRFWLTFLNKFAAPTPIASRTAEGNANQQGVMLQMLDKIASGSAAVIPPGYEVKLLEAARSSSVDSYESLVNFMNEEISKAVLGETLTTNIGDVGSYAAASVHNQIRIEISKADSDLLSATLNRTLIKWLVDLNFSTTEYPQVWRKFPELDAREDLNARAQRDSTIVQMSGRQLTQKYLETIYEVEFEAEQEEDNGPPALLDDGTGQAEPQPQEEVEGLRPESRFASAERLDDNALPPEIAYLANLLEKNLTLSPTSLDFGSKIFKKRSQCTKGYSCGYTCITRAKKCRFPLDGQAGSYAELLTQQFAAPMKFQTFKQTGTQPHKGQLVHVFSGSYENPSLRTKEVIRVSADGQTATLRKLNLTQEQKQLIKTEPSTYDETVSLGFVYDRKIDRVALVEELQRQGQGQTLQKPVVTTKKLELYNNITENPQYQKDLSKLTSQYLKMGTSKSEATKKAQGFLEMYASGYRVKPGR